MTRQGLTKCLLLSLQSRGGDVEAKTSYVSSAQRCIRNAAKWVCSSIDIPSCVANLVVKVSPRKGRREILGTRLLCFYFDWSTTELQESCIETPLFKFRRHTCTVHAVRAKQDVEG